MSLAPSPQMRLRCDTSDCRSDVVSGEGAEQTIAVARALGWTVDDDGAHARCSGCVADAR